MRVGAVQSRHASAMSAPTTAARRSWRPPGVPTPISRRMSRPRLKPPVCTSTLQDVGVTSQMHAAQRARALAHDIYIGRFGMHQRRLGASQTPDVDVVGAPLEKSDGRALVGIHII